METIFIQDKRRQTLQIFKDTLAGNPQMGIAPLVSDYDPMKALIMPFMIKVHTKFANNKTSFSLDLNVGTTDPLPVESKLEATDVFMGTSILLGVQKYNPAKDQGDFNSPILTNADPVYFGAAIAKQIMKLYNGNTTLKTNSQERIARFPNNLFYTNPENGFAGTLAAPTDFPTFGPKDEDRGFFDLGNYPIIVGGVPNKLEINLAPGDTSTVEDSGTPANTNNIVAIILGWVYRGNSGGNPGFCS